MGTENKATLVLETGQVFTGQAFGAEKDVVFELVFNTSMTGYQEILSDPSYRGQGVLFTVPHIGNVGINLEDYESNHPQVSAALVRDLSPVSSNWRATAMLADWLASNGVPGIAGIDTRVIVRKLRDRGTMRAGLSAKGTPSQNLLDETLAWPGLDGRDMVREVTCATAYHWLGDKGDIWVERIGVDTPKEHRLAKVVLYDFGAKRNISRHLAAHGADVWVVPAGTPAEEVLGMSPGGIMLSNGPGDPAGLPYVVENVRRLIESGLPILGICLGHQLIGLALGGRTARLKFGHHGGNHPVQDLRTGKVYITAQNHNYMVVPESLDLSLVEVTHLSLNDHSLEGMRLKEKPVMSVQFHPEAAPGPHDAHDIFTPFFEVIRKRM